MPILGSSCLLTKILGNIKIWPEIFYFSSERFPEVKIKQAWTHEYVKYWLDNKTIEPGGLRSLSMLRFSFDGGGVGRRLGGNYHCLFYTLFFKHLGLFCFKVFVWQVMILFDFCFV